MHVKICGVTNVEDALAAVAAGASAIGLNFVPSSARVIDVATARAISEAVGKRALIVGVVADRSVEEMRALVRDAALGCLQLHGDESPATLAALLPHAYKAIRVASAEDVRRADDFGGDYVLVDAWVKGSLGGTGQRVDAALVVPLARRRRLTLAGGLTPENVGEAIDQVRPWCVDVASGVEPSGDARRKDRARMLAFVEAAKATAARLGL